MCHDDTKVPDEEELIKDGEHSPCVRITRRPLNGVIGLLVTEVSAPT